SPSRTRRSALRHVDGEPALARLLVLAAHVLAGALHHADDVVEADDAALAGVQRELRRTPGLRDAHRVAFDARRLDEALDRVAGQPEVVLESDLGGAFDLVDVAAEQLAQGRGGHRRRAADLALAPDLRTRQA